MRFILWLSTGLFAAGVALALYVLPWLYGFAFQIQAPAGVSGTISLTEFVGQTLFFMLALGLTFQIPVVAYGLGYVGILTAKLMADNFRWALVGSFLAAFFISPGVGGD